MTSFVERCLLTVISASWTESMLTSSRDIRRRLERDGWLLERVAGSHHIFKHPNSRETIVLPHPRKDLGRGLVRAIYKQADWEPD